MAPKLKKPVKPILGGYGRSTSPQSRFEAFMQHKMHSSSPRGSEKPTIDETAADIVRSRTGSRATDTLNKKVLFLVEELLYPGDSAEPPTGQFVYVFSQDRHGTLLVEALCGETGWDQDRTDQGAKTVWFYRVNDFKSEDKYFEKPLTPKTKGVKKSNLFLPVPGVVEGEKIVFFLSPIPLTPDARKIVAANIGTVDGKQHGCAVRPVWPTGRGYVAVPEPTKWAEAVHEEWYLREVAIYQDWQVRMDQDMFVAAVLETWRKPMKLDGEILGSGDVRKIAEKAKKKNEHKKLAPLDASASHHLHVIDSHEHRAIDEASYAKPESMIWMASHWSKVLGGLVVTRAGRKFVYQLARGVGFGKERLPYKLLIDDNWPTLDFAQGRYLAIAINDAAGVILPYTKSLSGAKAGFIKRVSDLLSAGFNGSPPPLSADLETTRPKHWRNRASESIALFAKPFMFLIEVYNLAKSFQEWRKAAKAGEADWVQSVKLVGSGADFLGALGPFFDAKKHPWLLRAGGVMIVAGSVGDAAEFSSKAGKAVAEEDWSAWAGASLATAGAGVNMVAGASLLLLSEGLLLFAVAPYLLLVGGVLILFGSLIGSNDSPYEEFAEHSRFGKKYPLRIYRGGGRGRGGGGPGTHTHDTGVTLTRKWAQEPIGTRSRDKEVKTMIGMMCAFQIATETGREERLDNIMITPGYFPPGAKFEVKLNITAHSGRMQNGRWKSDKPKEEWISFEVAQTDPARYEYKDFVKDITRDKDGVITKIRISANRERVVSGGHVRLIVGPMFKVPPHGEWLKVGSYTTSNSFETDKYVT